MLRQTRADFKPNPGLLYPKGWPPAGGTGTYYPLPRPVGRRKWANRRQAGFGVVIENRDKFHRPHYGEKPARLWRKTGPPLAKTRSGSAQAAPGLACSVTDWRPIRKRMQTSAIRISAMRKREHYIWRANRRGGEGGGRENPKGHPKRPTNKSKVNQPAKPGKASHLTRKNNRSQGKGAFSHEREAVTD